MSNRRTADYVATLVYVDGPQLVLLKSHKTNIVALAQPSPDNQLIFLATSATQRNWDMYLDGSVDLRF